MTQPASIQMGETGESFGEHFFNKIGWGPVRTGKHDVGTDLFVQMRGKDLTELGLLLGVQVKYGDSWFNPGMVDGESGWWFKEGADHHGEYWRGHHAPHILIMVSEDEQTAVWALLDGTTIRSTGVGIKVFVPQSHRLEAGRKDEWIEYVVEARRRLSHEGSRWAFSTAHVPSNQWARFAMITPRIVSPHPNKGADAEFGWPEAIAVCVEGEPHRWDRFASGSAAVLDVPGAADTSDVGWRLAHAVHEWVTKADRAPFDQLATAELPDDIRSAVAIWQSVALESEDRLADGLAVLVAASDEDELSADQGWLSVHRARCLAELGDAEAAIAAINLANLQLGVAKDDVTLSAIRSAAIWLMFELTDPWGQTIPTVLPALDNAASWWRTQSTATGLEALLSKLFASWSEDESITLGASDVVNNELYSVALIAKLTGLQGQWRTAAANLARANLVSRPEGDPSTASSLNTLRRSGKDRHLRDAVRRTKARGPSLAVAEFMESVQPAFMTRSTYRKDLDMLKVAGSYCAEASALDWLDQLITALDDPAPMFERFKPRSEVLSAICDAVAGLAPFASETQVATLVEVLLTFPPATSDVLSAPIRRIVKAVELADTQRQMLADRAAELEPDFPLRWAFAAAAGRTETTELIFRTALLGGELEAVRSLKNLGELQEDEVIVLLTSCRAVMEVIMRELPDGPFNGYGTDYAYWFALLASRVSRSEDREFLGDFLKCHTALGPRKTNVLEHLAKTYSAMPEPDQQYFAQVAKEVPPDWTSDPKAISMLDAISMMGEPMNGALGELLLEIEPPESDQMLSVLTNLMTGSPDDRIHATHFMSRHRGYELQLATLLADSNDAVSVEAVSAMTTRLCTDSELTDVYKSALRRRVFRGGEDGVRAFLGAFGGDSGDAHLFDDWLEELETHPSLYVARSATERRSV